MPLPDEDILLLLILDTPPLCFLPEPKQNTASLSIDTIILPSLGSFDVERFFLMFRGCNLFSLMDELLLESLFLSGGV